MRFTAPFFSLLLFILALGVRVRSADEDLEVVLLPIEWNSNDATVPLRFSAFGKQVDLLLKRNDHLLAANFEVWKRKSNGSSRIDDANRAKHSACHYLHENSYSSAAVSLCDAGTVQGFIFYANDSLEITPLSSDDARAFSNNGPKVRAALGEPHVVKRRRISSFRDAHDEFDSVRVQISARSQESSTSSRSGYVNGIKKPNATQKTATVETLSIELAVFFDETAYKLFKPHFRGDEAKLIDLLLAYINNIQALYHHPSLGQRIDLALVRLELMQSQPKELAHLDGERGETLEAFCKYAKSLNPENDEDPKHWDMGLYVSGLDFYSVENGTKNPVTMGLAPVGGVCWDRYACVISEFGVNNKFGRPFPSAGFTSVYIAAHEMGHNLGMHHDSASNNCPKDGYIMSPSRGVKGETQWSTCSREVALALPTKKPCLLDKPGVNYLLEPNRHLDHKTRFKQVPGRHWSAKHQCELLLRDRDAFVESLEESCMALRCKSPKRAGLFLAGPALDGTKCADGKECRAGDCVPYKDNWELVATVTPSSKPSGWSNWSEGNCVSGCIRGSLGFMERRRTCLGDSECQGLNFDITLCKDSKVCEGKSRKRLTANEHASLRCLEFTTRGVDAINGTAGGLQSQHETSNLWIACAIFCKKKDNDMYYSPRFELNNLGVDPYFPDGTWCHRDSDGQDYFCRKHHCLPESFRFGKDLLPLDQQKLKPANSTSIERKFKLDSNSRSLARSIEGWTNEEEQQKNGWLDSKDYVETAAEAVGVW